MAETQREYFIGVINATNRPEPRETQLDDKMPATIRYARRTVDFRRGDEEEFAASMPRYEAKAAQLAAMKPDLILPGGAPPFMRLGFNGEREIIRDWEKKYGVPMFTSGQNHVLALNTLGIKKFIGISYFPANLNGIFQRYFTESGFRVLAMEGIPVQFADVPKFPPGQIADFIKNEFNQHREAEGIYMLGSAWKTLDIISELEQTLNVPVVHPGPARCWEIQLRLGLRQPIPGYGRLLAEMPEAAYGR
jgi:maleate cis-trans isomerase